MANITYKDSKGKPISKRDAEAKIKKYLKPKIEKVGKIYRIANNKYKAGK